MNPSSIWQTLGIDRTRDRGEIRRAYARRLKVTNPEDHAAGFQRLRAAYEQALAYAEQRAGAPPAEADNPGREAAANGERLQLVPDRGVLPVDPKAQHVAACQRLAALVTSPAPVDRAILVQALENVLSSPAFHDVGIQVETERWLAPLILFNLPRSDPLLDIAIARFGWSASAIDRKDMSIIRLLLQRRDDLRFLREIEHPESRHHRAFDALGRPPIRQSIVQRLFRPGRASEIRDLLVTIRTRRPTLIRDLNEATVTAWETYLARPRLSTWGLWAVLCTPVALALLGIAPRFVWPDDGSLADPHLLAIWLPLLLVPCLAAAALVQLYGVAWPRLLWSRYPSRWLGLGWAPSAMVLLIASAAAPQLRPVTFAIGVVAAAIALWVLVTRQSDRIQDDVLSPSRLVLAETLPMVWWFFLRSAFGTEKYIQMSVAFAAGIFAAAFGARPLVELWYGQMQGRARALGLLALLALTAGAAALLWLVSQEQEEFAPLTAAAIVAVALASRAPSVALGPRVAKLYHYVMRFSGAFIIVSLIGHSDEALLVGGAWLLAGVAIATCALLASEGRR